MKIFQQAIQQKLLPSQLNYEATSLKRRDNYVFWVTASTTVGEGEMSQSVHLKLSNKGRLLAGCLNQVNGTSLCNVYKLVMCIYDDFKIGQLDFT